MMASRKKKKAVRTQVLTPKNKGSVRKVLLAAVREKGYAPLARRLKVCQTTLLATLVGGLARESSETLVLERFAKMIKRAA